MTVDNSIPLTINSVDLQRRLGVSRATIYRWIRSGALTPLKWTGRNRLFNFQDMLTFIRTPAAKK
jgi:excisionase family DNA binding protein